MLEIASQIVICLLVAALIGFIIGYILGKGQSKKINPVSTEEAENTAVAEEKTEKAVEIEEDTLSAEEVSTEAKTEETEKEPEEVQIPTEDVIAQAVEALEEVNAQETETETETAETETAETETAETEIAEDENEKPELLTAARNGKKDKLTEIKGIGPKVEEKLNEAGIYHFDQIASWTNANIKWLEIHTTFAHRAKKDLWVIQAKSL